MPNSGSQKSSGPNLAETQALLKQLITAPDDVATILQQRPDLVLPVKPSKTLTAVERVQIYANMYSWRLHDALAEDFQAVRAYLGPQRFYDLIAQYLVAHPPTSYTLRFAGQHLPDFLRTHVFAQTFPFLSDVAQFEWALLDTFDAPDAQPANEATLQDIPPHQWPFLRFRLIPAHTLLPLQWPIDAIHNAVTGHDTAADAETPSDAAGAFQRTGETVSSAKTHDACAEVEYSHAAPKQHATTLLVWRKEDTVYYRALESLEALLLTALQSGATFADLCNTALAHVSEDDATVTISGLLGHWVHSRLLTLS